MGNLNIFWSPKSGEKSVEASEKEGKKIYYDSRKGLKLNFDLRWPSPLERTKGMLRRLGLTVFYRNEGRLSKASEMVVALKGL